jgi:hypothetical protein
MKATAYVLNLDRREDRWIQCQRLWGQYFNLVRFPAIDIPGNGALGCKRSHNAVAEQYLRNEEFIVALEDDAEPTTDFESIGMKCIESAKRHLRDWDLANCGPFLDLTPIGGKKAILHDCDSEMFLSASNFHQTHMMLYNRNSLPILGASIGSRLPIDMYLGRSEVRKWVPVRLLSTQSHADSDVGHEFKGQQELYRLSENMLHEAVPEL